ncbi:DinB family protein [Leucobacter allii]|uniref:DinB family protein n=1 Tax=Leucobacter allii TaxID=2932247 RepID=A0ABY4FJP0_9MICO|nr:DinB family protein [Leucobacter allii]UOQ56219.1 DinB family protein [Leucobacter allii]
MAHEADPEIELHLGYLQRAREALLWKLEGIGEYDARRPLTPTGTNLLGIVKHVSGTEYGYLTECLGRDGGIALPWMAEVAADNADMWATAEERREDVVELYRRVWRSDDAVVRELGPDATGAVPWWGGEVVTVRRLLVHMIAETHRHAGHADILRETLDGAAGMRADAMNLPPGDAAWWRGHVAEVEAAARAAAVAAGEHVPG